MINTILFIVVCTLVVALCISILLGGEPFDSRYYEKGSTVPPKEFSAPLDPDLPTLVYSEHGEPVRVGDTLLKSSRDLYVKVDWIKRPNHTSDYGSIGLCNTSLYIGGVEDYCYDRMLEALKKFGLEWRYPPTKEKLQ